MHFSASETSLIFGTLAMLSPPHERTSQRIPLKLLTGFLGSGKTTLLRVLLRQPPFRRTAVVIGEFGEIAIDHHLIRPLGADVMTLMDGCPCCTLQGDLVATLRELWRMRSVERSLDFERIVFETSGVSEPGPIVNAILADPGLATRLQLDGVLCTVDAVHVQDTLARRRECVRQIAYADHLILTKADLVGATHAREIARIIAGMAPDASIHIAKNGQIESGESTFDGPTMTQGDSVIDQWLGTRRHRSARETFDRATDAHSHGLTTFSLTASRPLNWTAVVTAFSGLLAAHGHEILRIKGVLDIIGRERPTAIHAVQHVLYPPVELPTWANEPRRSQVVFITERLGLETVKERLWDQLSIS